MVDVALEPLVVAFTILPCFFFTFVVLFALFVVLVVPEASEAELVVVDDSSTTTFRPLSVVVVVLVDSESEDCDAIGTCAIMAAAVKTLAMNIFMSRRSAREAPNYAGPMASSSKAAIRSD